MERKVGEIFEYNGEWYQCVKSPDGSCKHCDMNFGGKCPIPIKECVASARSDLFYVIFKKLEKVGEPYYNSDKKLCQQYKCYTEPLIADEIVYVFDDNKAVIEIKQTKEDMEEKKLNLKPFDLQKAKEGKPVCTRDGRKARIICFDRIDSTGCNLPIVALIQCEETEVLRLYHDNGKRNVEVDLALDLMMLPEKKEGWVNVYKDSVYDTKYKALIGRSEIRDYIDTIKISWEE